MISITLILAICLATATATPVYSAMENGEAGITKRDFTTEAIFYTGWGCLGYVSSVINFGCGGTCHEFNGINSIELTGPCGCGDGPCPCSKKPTASCFWSSGCTGDYQSIGVWDGYNTGCTVNNKLGVNTWKSCYLYYGC